MDTGDGDEKEMMDEGGDMKTTRAIAAAVTSDDGSGREM